MYQSADYTFEFTEPEKHVFRKKPKLKVSQWAEKNMIVIDGPKKGPWSNSMTPYLVKPMDAWNDPWIQKIVLRFSPQTGKTMVAFACLMFSVDYDPDSAMYCMADEKTARRISRRRILPMLKNSPAIAKLISPRSDDTATLNVKFQNGMDLTLVWATSAAELSSEAYRYVVFDEAEKYPAIAGREGDPIYLGEVRTTAYPYTRKILYSSTPNEEAGAIMRAESEADQHWTYKAKCPVCGCIQTMIFDRIVWPKVDWRTIRRKKLARYQCEKCIIDWTDHIRTKAVSAGFDHGDCGWHTENEVDRPLAVSFYLPSWYSPFVSLSDVAADFIQGQGDPAKLKIFVTQRKAEPWKQVIIKSSEVEILKARVDLPPQTVPIEAVALSAGIDLQKFGFWFVVRAWARDFTSWLIHYGFLSSWIDVEKLLFETTYPVRDGAGDSKHIWRAGMDTGGGGKHQDMSMTEEAYWWIRDNGIGRGCRIYATKGSSRPLASKVHAGKPLDKTPSGKPLPGGLQIISLDTDKVKDMVFYRLAQAVQKGAYASYLHKDTGQDYASQMTAEEKQRDKKGHETWTQIRKDNHFIDCECLAQIVVDPEWPGGGLQLIKSGVSAGKAVKTGRQVISKGFDGVYP